jgi:type II secretory pathway component GspD/PulD (secretin)
LIELQVVELGAGELENLPINWNGSAGAQRYATDPDRSISSAITALVQKNRATILCRPTLMAISGERSFISLGTGTKIEVTPTVRRNGTIGLAFRARVAHSTTGIGPGETEPSERCETRIDSLIEAKSDETLVVAGPKVSNALTGNEAGSDVVLIATPLGILD